MSEFTTFEWNVEKLVWFLSFLLSVFSSITGWSAKHVDEELHHDLKGLSREISDMRQRLLHRWRSQKLEEGDDE